MATGRQGTLVVVPSISAVRNGESFHLDRKAVDGLIQYASLWDGPVRCIMREGRRDEIAFGADYSPDDLPFELRLTPSGARIKPAHLDGASVVLGSGDNYLDYGIVDATTAPVVYVVENPLSTRLSILRLTSGASLRTAKSALWTINSERHRRRAFRKAAGLQCNGRPAFDSYGALTGNSLLFFDTRTTYSRVIGSDDLWSKKRAILAGGPLRLAFSGRLDPIKGVEHLVPTLEAVRAAGISATLDVYGDGPSRQKMEAQIASAGLGECVRLHGAVDFDTELMPAMMERADLFLCCHRQADPSCTYLETLACGVPIVGYRNAAFAGVMELGPVGRATPVDDVAELARDVIVLNSDRQALSDMMDSAAKVGLEHSFELVFTSGIEHLGEVASAARPTSGRWSPAVQRSFAGRPPGR